MKSSADSATRLWVFRKRILINLLEIIMVNFKVCTDIDIESPHQGGTG